MMFNRVYVTTFAVACVAAVSLSGCASKKYVRGTVAPVETRVGEVETKTAENTTKIGDLEERVDTDVSRLDERVKTALEDAAGATSKAERAQQSADAANKSAGDAKQFAGDGITRIERTLADLANYRLVTQEAVLFGFDRAELTDEAKQQLATVARATGNTKRYVLEVRGFTDPTGSADYNLQLSQRRAEAVVRHLAAEHQIPLRSIHRVGLGQVSSASTREERAQSRKVEVSVYVPIAEGGTEVSRTR